MGNLNKCCLSLVLFIVSACNALNCSENSAFTPYTISNRNGDLRVQIIPFGGTLTHLYFRDARGVTRDLLLGWDDPTQYCKNATHPYFGALIGRYANRIANGTFTLNGVTYKLPLNDKDWDTLHGGTVGFDSRVWDVQQVSASNVVLTLHSPAGEMGFPGNLAVKVSYAVTDLNEFEIEYYATSLDEDTVINLSNHAYWNLNGFAENYQDILNLELKIDASTYVEVDAHLIPTGTLGNVAKDFWLDFTKPKLVGKDIARGTVTPTGGYDNAFVLDSNSNPLHFSSLTAYSNLTGITLSIYTTQPSIQFYTGNFLDGTIPRKKDQTYGDATQFYQQYSAVVFETQHYPDSVHHPAWPTTILRKGQNFYEKTVYRLSS